MMSQVHLTNPVNSTTAAVMTIISVGQQTLSRCVKCTVSHVVSFSHCPLELPSIVPLPCLILSSSHCVYVKKLVPLLGSGRGDARLKGPRGESFLNPACPPGLMQCNSLLLGVFVRHSRGSITSGPCNDNLCAPETRPHPPSKFPSSSDVLLPCPGLGQQENREKGMRLRV